MTPLHILAFNNPADLDTFACLEVLLNKRAPFELRDCCDRTPLMTAQFSAAYYTRDYSLAVGFLERGASAAECFREQLQATFFKAIVLGAAKAVEELVRAGADLNARDKESDKTAYQLADEYKRDDVLEVLRKAARGKKSDHRDTT